jgi:hypothetical protein
MRHGVSSTIYILRFLDTLELFLIKPRAVKYYSKVDRAVDRLNTLGL